MSAILRTSVNSALRLGHGRWAFLIAFSVTASLPFDAASQTNAPINSGVQFDFPPPGARSLALGGAFVSVADDATAAVANPAGLTILARPEVSIEGRYWNFETVSPVRGRYIGSPTNVGIDTTSEFVKQASDRSESGVSFLSAVIPRNRFAVAFYRQEQSRFRAASRSEGIFLLADDRAPAGTKDRLDPYTGELAVDLVSYGVSAAYRFANGLAIGGGLAVSTFSIESRTDSYYIGLGPVQIPPADRHLYTAPGQAFGPPDFSEANRTGGVRESGDDTSFAPNFGVLYRPAGSKWTAGGAFRRGPKFEYNTEFRWGPVQDRFPGPPNSGDLYDSDRVTFKIPDTYSFGMSYRPTDRLLFAGQYDRVQYSQLSEDVKDVFGTAEPVLTEWTKGLSYPDSNQARFGAEYAVSISPHVISLRAGTAFVSDHQMRYQKVADIRYPRLEVLFLGGQNEWHFTPGAGIAFAKFQIDGAFDISDLNKTFSLSAVYRF